MTATANDRGTHTKGPKTSKTKSAQARSTTSPAASPVGDGPTDLGTIQSILFGDFDARTQDELACLRDSIDATRVGLEARIEQLEAELDSERARRKDAHRKLANAQATASAQHNQALGRVKADNTRARRALRRDIDEVRQSSVDRVAFSHALRTLADSFADPDDAPTT